MGSFHTYFEENMNSLDLPAPAQLFGNLQTTVGTLNQILAALEKFGPRVTVIEVARAGTKLEVLAAVGAISAAYYAGAVIGSLAVAVRTAVREHGRRRGARMKAR
ncbi:MAG TPA: hypothetical protein VFF16_10465 [Telluria sp.]|nr:hypothetical protein [Telluria sp.]